MKTEAISQRRRHLMIAGMAAAALPITLRAQECTPLPGNTSRSPRVSELVAAAEGEKLVVSGRVTGSDCRPLAGALVEVWSAAADDGVSTTTDGDGRFFLTTASAPGSLQVRVSHDGHTLQAQRRLTTESLRDESTAHLQRDDAGVWRTTLALTFA